MGLNVEGLYPWARVGAPRDLPGGWMVTEPCDTDERDILAFGYQQSS